MFFVYLLRLKFQELDGMKKVSKRACTKVAGCPAFSCDADNCAAKKFGSHKPAVDTSTAQLHNHIWYHGTKWRRLRLQQLAAQPLCQRCLVFETLSPGHHVDHVISHQGNAALFFNSRNLQTLCLSCHSVKTRREQAGEILDYRSGEEVVIGTDRA